MRLKAERIQLLPSESFRLLQWQNNIHEVETVATDGTRRRFSGSGHEWHHHSHMELTLITQGSGTLFIGDSITHFKAPDLVLIGPNLPHYWHIRQNSSGYALQFDFGAEHPFWQFPETKGLQSLWKESRRGLRITGQAAAAVANLIRTSSACDGMGRLSTLIQILDALLHTASRNRKSLSSTTFVPSARAATYLSLQKAVYRVFHSFHESLLFTDVLHEAGMSKSTFERHFKKHTGKTFTQSTVDRNRPVGQ